MSSTSLCSFLQQQRPLVANEDRSAGIWVTLREVIDRSESPDWFKALNRQPVVTMKLPSKLLRSEECGLLVGIEASLHQSDEKYYHVSH